MEKIIACVGAGFVGGSLTTVFAEKGFDVYTYDKSGKVAEGTRQAFASLDSLVKFVEIDSAFSGVFFVCLPTPMKIDGSCDLSIVEGTLDVLSQLPGSNQRIAVVKSTIPPGTTERWNQKYADTNLKVVFSPEFLREASALDDMRNQDRIILGGPKRAVNRARDVFRIAFPDVDVHKTSSTNAELVKYTINTFLATKVSFANEISQICEKLFDSGQDADYDRVIELATLDKRLGSSHWKVPGPMPADDGTGRLLPGWAGSCFIKDMNALMFVAKSLGVDPKVLNGAWQKNLEVRPEKDWERLIGRAVVEKK